MTVAAKVKALNPIVVVNIFSLLSNPDVQSDVFRLSKFFAVPNTWGMKMRLPVQKHTLCYTIL